jgi:hypothetical protein
MKIKVEFSNEKITDLLITALEGGSNYWYWLNDEDIDNLRKLFKKGSSLSSAEKIGKAVLEKGCTVRVSDVETGEELGILSKDSIREGFSLMLKENDGSAQIETMAHILCDDYDANDADIWFQTVIMKEIVYG